MSERKPIGAKLRFEIFKRDGFVCQYCGSHPPKAILHVDHVVAVARGGDNDIDNLITACSICNLGKGANDLHVAPLTVNEKAALVAEKEAQLRGYNEVMEAKRTRLESDVWRVVEHLTGEASTTHEKFNSIKMFVDKLGLHEALDAVDIAKAKRPRPDYAQWKYFCGVCWGKIKQGQE